MLSTATHTGFLVQMDFLGSQSSSTDGIMHVLLVVAVSVFGSVGKTGIG